MSGQEALKDVLSPWLSEERAHEQDQLHHSLQRSKRLYVENCHLHAAYNDLVEDYVRMRELCERQEDQLRRIRLIQASLREALEPVTIDLSNEN